MLANLVIEQTKPISLHDIIDCFALNSLVTVVAICIQDNKMLSPLATWHEWKYVNSMSYIKLLTTYTIYSLA